jgi:uncharacterized membrane protein YfcA
VLVDVLVAVAVMVAAALQSVTGFGFALVAAPALVAAHGTQASVSVIAVLGPLVCLLALTTEGRRPAVDAEAARALGLWALPGLAAGVLLLDRLPERGLEAAVGVAVLAAVAMRQHDTRGGSRRDRVTPRDGQTIAAGLASGALTTTVGINGPPLVLRLMRAGAPPLVARDTLAVLFVGLGAVGLGSLAIGGLLDLPGSTPVLALAAVAGQVAGRPVLARLHPEQHQRAVTALLVLAGIGALAGAVL